MVWSWNLCVKDDIWKGDAQTPSNICSRMVNWRETNHRIPPCRNTEWFETTGTGKYMKITMKHRRVSWFLRKLAGQISLFIVSVSLRRTSRRMNECTTCILSLKFFIHDRWPSLYLCRFVENWLKCKHVFVRSRLGTKNIEGSWKEIRYVVVTQQRPDKPLLGISDPWPFLPV